MMAGQPQAATRLHKWQADTVKKGVGKAHTSGHPDQLADGQASQPRTCLWLPVQHVV